MPDRSFLAAEAKIQPAVIEKTSSKDGASLKTATAVSSQVVSITGISQSFVQMQE